MGSGVKVIFTDKWPLLPHQDGRFWAIWWDLKPRVFYRSRFMETFIPEDLRLHEMDHASRAGKGILSRIKYAWKWRTDPEFVYQDEVQACKAMRPAYDVQAWPSVIQKLAQYAQTETKTKRSLLVIVEDIMR